MEDKRIIKTKRNIKATLINLLADMPFEKITVAELCRMGVISRITFYTHYEDKYALVEEIFQDYIREGTENYQNLQKEKNPQKDVLIGYQNLLEAILRMYFDNFNFFSHTAAEENPYLYSVYFQHVYSHVVEFMKKYKELKPNYPVRQVAALLCNGLFGAINMSIADRMSEKKVCQMARSMYVDMLQSNLFSRVDGHPSGSAAE